MTANACPIHFDPLSPAQLADPYGLYARLREEQPVFYAENLGLWIVTRYEDVVAVAKDHTTFSSRDAVRSSTAPPAPEVQAELAKGFGEAPSLTDSDEPYHKRLRGLAGRAFTHRRVAELEPRIVAFANTLIDGWVDDGEVDVIERFGWSLPLLGIGGMLGVPEEDVHDLHVWSYDWLKLIQATDPVEDQVRYARSFVALQHYVMNALEERNHRPRDDLMSALLDTRTANEPGLTLDEAMRVPLNLIIAGHVTVTRAVGNSLVLLFDHPRALEELRAQPELMPTAVEELLRLESPAQGLFRTTTREMTLGEVALPEGARIMVHFGSANRDPATFEHPDRLDLRRRDVMRHVAFGKGIHVCLGAPLARLELQIALRALLDRLPGLRPAPGALPERDTIFFARGFSRLRVAWDPPLAPETMEAGPK